MTNEFLGKSELNERDVGHAVICVGYQQLGHCHYVFRILNSWGRHFHDDGFFYLEYDKNTTVDYYQV